ncbi:BTB/POZ domain-containing protein [Ditylenchus destructor]|nr:BTB/POZ domain-containing protein [Ditylenchus destructor]
MNDYSDLVIVAEEAFYSRKREATTVHVYNTIWEIKEDLDKRVQDRSIDRVVFQKSSSDEEIFSLGFKLVMIRKTFKVGDCAADDKHYHSLVIIRILEEKQNFVKEFDLRSAADVTFVVNGEECKADRMCMATASPVFKTMLYGQFAEAQQDKILLEDIESAEIFKDFLLAISPLRVQRPTEGCHSWVDCTHGEGIKPPTDWAEGRNLTTKPLVCLVPNLTNVVSLLKLAHRYDIPFLMRNCEDRLIHSYEIPIVERILLAGKYNLNALKAHIPQMVGPEELKKIFKEAHKQLKELDSDFILYLVRSFLSRSEE